jgi:protein TonB
MDKNNQYFILSGFFSIVLFALVLFLFLFMMFSVRDEKMYALKKANYISVSISIPLKSAKSRKRKSSTLKSNSSSVSKNIDVNDLFSDVWTKKITTKKQRKKNSKRIQDIAKKLKTVEKKSVDSISEKIEKIATQESKENQDQSSTANEVNEYLAKIQAIVYQYFHVPPNSEGNSVKTVIELDPLGRMIDFRILNYSANEALNAEADKIKERLRNVVFPKNPQNRSSRTVVVLISKE